VDSDHEFSDPSTHEKFPDFLVAASRPSAENWPDAPPAT
jgi:hypothetical protein